MDAKDAYFAFDDFVDHDMRQAEDDKFARPIDDSGPTDARVILEAPNRRQRFAQHPPSQFDIVLGIEFPDRLRVVARRARPANAHQAARRFLRAPPRFASKWATTSS